MGKFALNLNKLAIFIWKLIVLNFLWLGGTLLGLVIFGLGPATTALCATLRNDLRYKDNSIKEICKYFIEYYKDNFKRTTILFLPVIALAYLLFVSNRYYMSINGSVTLLYRISILISMIITLSIFIFLPSVYAHYHYDKLYKYYIFTIVLIARRLHTTIVVLIIPCLALIAIGAIFPGLILLMGVSLSYYITNFYIYKDLNKLLDKKE